MHLLELEPLLNDLRTWVGLDKNFTKVYTKGN